MGHNSGKNQLSMTSIKYDHLQVMGTITAKFHQNPLKTVGGVADTRLCLRTDERTEFRKIADGVMALILCIPSDVASYLFKDYENFFDSSKF